MSGGAGAISGAVVIDNGSGTVKSGYAGNDAPRSVMPNTIGRPKQSPRVDLGELEFYVGHAAVMCGGGDHDLSSPVSRGRITNLLDQEKVLHHVLFRELTVIPEESPILMLDSPEASASDREELSAILFEKFSSPSLYLMMQSVAAMLATARTYGLVLDAGHGVTHVVPIYEGLALPHGIVTHKVGGADLNRVLRDLLTNRSVLNMPDAAISEMKEKLCHVALDYSKEAAAADGNSVSYQLPDGRSITLHDERLAVLECMFNPSVCDMCGVDAPQAASGVQEAIGESLYRVDAEVRKKLWDSVVLAGGSTLGSGFVERLERELPSVVPQGCTMSVVAPATRKYSPWIGGSIQASLDTFNEQMWITLNEYNEYGSSVLHRRLY